MTSGDANSLVFVSAAKVGDLEPDTAVAVEIGGLRIAVFNVEGAFYATDEICSHAYASLAEGFIVDDTVECPLHGACFSLKTGEALSAPATEPLTTYPVKVEDGHILVGVPA